MGIAGDKPRQSVISTMPPPRRTTISTDAALSGFHLRKTNLYTPCSRTATAETAAPPTRTPLAHTPPARPQRHRRTGTTTADLGAQGPATITRTTQRQRTEPPNLPPTEHRCSRPRMPQSTTERERRPAPMRGLTGSSPRSPAPPENRAVQGHRTTPTGDPATQEEKAPADPATRGEEDPAATVCRAGLAGQRPPATARDGRCGGGRGQRWP
jgi:hypothetical protein